MAVTVEQPRGHRVQEYQAWVEAQGLPIHRGYFVEDFKTAEVGPWVQRGTGGCFFELAGQEGWTQICVEEIPPGATSNPFKMATDDLIFVADGRGSTTIWAEGERPISFEWAKFSLFLIPANFSYQFSNMQGALPARVVHYNYLPMAMETVRDPTIMFDCPVVDKRRLYGGDDFYAAAETVEVNGVRSNLWRGSFFPDTLAWDKLEPTGQMGVGMSHVGMRFPGSPIWAHISAFEPFTYKKAHRHGPGTIVILLSGEGYSLMYPEGADPVVCPWHEGAAIVPPNAWFHHHFVLSPTPARTLALHRSRLHPGLGETVEDYERNEVQYWQEAPAIRERFERELGQRGYASQMPPACYADRDFDPGWGRQGAEGGRPQSPSATDFAGRTRDYRIEREVN
jgi:hypothetical protein